MVPAVTPVTNPPVPIVATAVLLLLHTPDPVTSLNVVVPPKHRSETPLMAATVVGAFTVTTIVAYIDPQVLVMV